MAQDKRYGLIFPKISKRPALSAKLAIFNDDSDDEKTSISAKIKKESEKNITKKQTQIEVQKALEENPTVYEYDSIYDELQKQKEDVKVQEKKEKKPRYIEALKKAAEIRKRENEKRVEKKIQKEREAEGEEFKDKEAFVTSAYKKKLQELQEEEEREEREKQIEAMLDVTKQKDLSGFYRHLLKQEVGEEKIPHITDRDRKLDEKSEVLNSSDRDKQKNNDKDRNKDGRREKKNSSSLSSSDDVERTTTKGIKSDSKRKGHSPSPDHSSSKGVVKEDGKVPTSTDFGNLDADSDIPINSDSEEDKKEVSNSERHKESTSVKRHKDSRSDKRSQSRDRDVERHHRSRSSSDNKFADSRHSKRSSTDSHKDSSRRKQDAEKHSSSSHSSVSERSRTDPKHKRKRSKSPEASDERHRKDKRGRHGSKHKKHRKQRSNSESDRDFAAEDKAAEAETAKLKENGHIGELEDGTEKSTDLKDGEETGADLKDGEETGADLKDGKETGADLKDGEETGADLKDGKETGADLKDGEEKDVKPDPMLKFVKRTVGKALEEARERFLARKEAREKGNAL